MNQKNMNFKQKRKSLRILNKTNHHFNDVSEVEKRLANNTYILTGGMTVINLKKKINYI